MLIIPLAYGLMLLHRVILHRRQLFFCSIKPALFIFLVQFCVSNNPTKLYVSYGNQHLHRTTPTQQSVAYKALVPSQERVSDIQQGQHSAQPFVFAYSGQPPVATHSKLQRLVYKNKKQKKNIINAVKPTANPSWSKKYSSYS